MNSDLEAALPPATIVGRHTLTYGEPPEAAQYGKFTERIRQSAPGDFQCSVFCGGKKCKYESPSFWNKEDMAIDGIFSHWITDKILAMSRPSTEVINKYNVIQQFKGLGIKSLINLQRQGEHAACCDHLEESGFTYDPQVFMENNIFYYNFTWKDYGTVHKGYLIDMVKVISFALTEGKVAIHCHAGLGRTGVLAACFLVYSLRCKPNDAVSYVRLKRPNSIHTKGQVECVQQFAQFVVPLFTVFSHIVPRAFGFTLNHYVRGQRYLLHGVEARLLRFIPKLLYVVCERLLTLMNERRKSSANGVILNLSGSNKDQHLPEGLFSSSSNGSFTHQHRFHLPPFTLPPGNKGASNQMVNQNVTSPPVDASVVNGILDKLGAPSHRTTIPFKLIGCGFRNDDDDVMESPLTDEEEEVNGDDLETVMDDIVNEMDKDEKKAFQRVTDIVVDDVGAKNANEMDVIEDIIGESSNDSMQNAINDIVGCLESDEKKEKLHDGQEVMDIPDGSPKELTQLVKDVEESTKKDIIEDLNSEECNAFVESMLMEEDNEQSVQTAEGKGGDKNGVSGLKGVGKDGGRRTFNNYDIAESLLVDHYVLEDSFLAALRQMQRNLNSKPGTWELVSKETDPLLLSALLWSWLDHLREPVLNKQDLSCIVIRATKPLEALNRLDNGTRYTTTFLIHFLTQLHPKSPSLRDDLLRRLVASLAHQCLGIRNTLRPLGVKWSKMRQGTTGQVMLFVQKLYDIISGKADGIV